MLKTQQFNDFRVYDYNQLNNYDFMLQEMRNFVENGGNLNLPVIDRNDTVYSFIDFIKKEFDSEFMGKLLQENLIDSPFKFTFNETSIVEDKEYGLSWMNNHYNLYSQHIIKAIGQIAKETNGHPIDTYCSYNHNDKLQYHKKEHPLFYIASHFQAGYKGYIPEIWATILENNQEIHTYMRDYLSQQENFEDFFNVIRDNIENTRLANTFFKYDLITDYLLKNSEKIHDLIKDAVSSDDVEAFLKIKKHFNIADIEKLHSSSESYLLLVRSPEMAKEVLDCNCFCYGQWKGKDSTYTYAFSETMDAPTINAIVQIVDKDLVKNHHLFFFNKFFDSNSSNMDTMKSLIENNQFPSEKYDILGKFYTKRYGHNYMDNMRWALEHGADPRNCSDLVSHIVARREEGKKDLVALRKEGLIDPLSADMVYNMLGQTSLTKTFINYYDKLTPEQLSRYTKDGKPAWWGISTESNFKNFKNRIKNINQTAQNGDGWLTEVFVNFSKNRNDYSSRLEFLKSIKSKLKDEKIIGTSQEPNNFLHHMFKTSQYGSYHTNKEIIEFIFENVDADFKSLINQKNEYGHTPLMNFFYFTNHQEIEPIKDTDGKINNYDRIKETLEALTQALGKDFPFEQEIEGKKAIEHLKENYETIYENIKSCYLTVKLEKDLENKTRLKGVKI